MSLSFKERAMLDAALRRVDALEQRVAALEARKKPGPKPRDAMDEEAA